MMERNLNSTNRQDRALTRTVTGFVYFPLIILPLIGLAISF